MKIIGHRGAAGLAHENTAESITAAIKAGVDGVEFDIRMTLDGIFVVNHDRTLRRTGGHRVTVAETDYKQLRRLKLKNGKPVASLTEALHAAANTPTYVEVKGDGWASKLADYIRQRDDITGITVIAIDHQELAKFHAAVPEIPVYVVQRFSPIDVLQTIRDARRMGCIGVDLNFWLLNPYTYWLARRYKLDIIVYAVNSTLIARFLHWLFPAISITTNHPDKLSFLRSATAQLTI